MIDQDDTQPKQPASAGASSAIPSPTPAEEPVPPEDPSVRTRSPDSVDAVPNTKQLAPREGPKVVTSGDELGRYRIQRVLGEGGMGRVYRAEDPQLGRFVALKVLRPTLGPAGEDDRKRLLREAQALARLTHPNLVRVYDAGTFDDQVFIAMEYVDGHTLETWLREAPRDWREVVRTFVEAGRGLASVHAAGLVHRDFKPGNVMIADDGRVLVLDLGLAREADDLKPSQSGGERASAMDDALGTELTQAGGILGTPAYMAPEQHLGVRADARTDQFSFCVALFEALYGRRPFTGRSPLELMEAALSGLRKPPAPVGDLPLSVRNAIFRGLSPERENRFESMDRLLVVLEGALSTDDRRPRWRTWLGVGAVVVAGTAAITWNIATERIDAPDEAGRSESTTDAPSTAPNRPVLPAPAVPAVPAPDDTAVDARGPLPNVDELPEPERYDAGTPDVPVSENLADLPAPSAGALPPPPPVDPQTDDPAPPSVVDEPGVDPEPAVGGEPAAAPKPPPAPESPTPEPPAAGATDGLPGL